MKRTALLILIFSASLILGACDPKDRNGGMQDRDRGSQQGGGPGTTSGPSGDSGGSGMQHGGY